MTTLRSACVPVKCAAFLSNAVPRSVPLVTKKTACVNSARPVPPVGAGIRPTVRGKVMNPVDHPHGGGEGRTGTGRPPVTPWGQLTKGYRTRNSKRTDSMIVQRRYDK